MDRQYRLNIAFIAGELFFRNSLNFEELTTLKKDKSKLVNNEYSVPKIKEALLKINSALHNPKMDLSDLDPYLIRDLARSMYFEKTPKGKDVELMAEDYSRLSGISCSAMLDHIRSLHLWCSSFALSNTMMNTKVLNFGFNQ